MLSEMNALEWQEWQVFMHLSPTGEEVAAIRAAHIPAAIWNVQIAKAQGAWDASKNKRGSRPEFRHVHEFIVRTGDMPDYAPPPPKPRDDGIFDMFVDYFQASGMKPVKQ